MLAAIAALVFVYGATGCDATGCEEPGGGTASDAPEAPETRQMVLDESVRYVYRDFTKGRRHAEHLDQVPLEQRGAVILHVEGEAADEEAVYVADLLDATPGESVRAEKMTLRDHFQRARAAELGSWHAKLVAFAAQERAKLDPRSERSAASREAKKLMDHMIQEKQTKEVPR